MQGPLIILSQVNLLENLMNQFFQQKIYKQKKRGKNDVENKDTTIPKQKKKKMTYVVNNSDKKQKKCTVTGIVCLEI